MTENLVAAMERAVARFELSAENAADLIAARLEYLTHVVSAGAENAYASARSEAAQLVALGAALLHRAESDAADPVPPASTSDADHV